ncbi:MAG: YfhO family protein [Thermodesulfobacteriota bacterium]
MKESLIKKYELVDLGIILLATFIVFVLPDICGFHRWPNRTNQYTEPCCIVRGAESMYTVRDYIAQGVREGHLPQWLHASGIGYPIALQYCWQIYNPLEWLWWNDSNVNRTVVLWLYLALCGYILLLMMIKIFKVDKFAALVSAFIYILSSWALWYYTYWYYITILLPLVLILYSALTILYRGKYFWSFTLLCLGLILFVLNGQPQVIFCSAIGLLVLLFLIVSFDRKRIVSIGKSLLLFGAASLAAILITAWQGINFVIDQLKAQTWSQHDVSLGVSYWVTSIANLFKVTSPYIRGFFYSSWFFNDRLGSVPWEDFALSFGVVGFFLILVATVYSTKKAVPTPNDTHLGHSQINNLVLLRCFAAVFYTILFTIAWHATMPRGYGYWPFSFINFSRYFVPIFTLFGAVLAGIGVQKINYFKAKENVILMGIVSLIPLFGYNLLFVASKRPVVAEVALHAALLTFIPLVVFLGLLVGGYYYLKINENIDRKHLHACMMMLVFSELFLFARYSPYMDKDMARLIPYLIFIALIAVVLTKKYKLALAGGIVFIITTAIVLAVFQDNESRTNKVLNKRYDLAAKFIFETTKKQAAQGYRPRVLSTCIRNQYIGFNAQYRLDQMATFIPIVSRAWAGFIFEFLRPEMLRNHGLSILPNMYGGMWPVYEGAKGGIYWKEFFGTEDYYKILGVTHLMGLHDGPLSATLERHPDFMKRVKLVYTTPLQYFKSNHNQIEIYAINNPLPRVFIANKFRIIPFTNDGWYARKVMKSDKAKLINEPVVEVQYKRVPKFATITDIERLNNYCLGGRDVSQAVIKPQRIIHYSSDLVQIETNSDHCGLLVLNDAYNDNWFAYIDKRKTDVFRVNSLMRGVFVKKGKHIIVFRYKPNQGAVLYLPVVGLCVYLITTLLLFLFQGMAVKRGKEIYQNLKRKYLNVT